MKCVCVCVSLQLPLELQMGVKIPAEIRLPLLICNESRLLF